MKKIINYVVGITISIFVFVLCSCDLLFGILQNAAEELFTDVPDVSNEAEALERSDFLFVTTDDNQFEIDINNDYYLLKVNASQEKGYDSNGTNRMSEIISSNKELFNNRPEELVRVRDFNQNFRIEYTEDLFRAVDINEKPVQYKVGDSKIFYFMGQGQKNIEKTGILKAVGSKCRIWYVDNANRNLNVSSNLSRKNEFNNLQKLFDDVIFAKETNVFGSNVPAKQFSNIIKVNENSFIDIVLCDILEDAEVEQENKGGVYGYFYSLDMITNEYLESYYKDKEHDISNQAEIFFVDSYFLDKSPKACYSTLAHEFQHMLNYVNKQLNNQVQSKTWFNEMLSMCCEELLQDDLRLTDEETPKGRLGYFNIAPDYGFNDYIWNALKENTGTWDYANTYAFGTYLMHNYGGANLIKQIATNNQVNEEAVTAALKSVYDSNFNFTKALLQFSQILVNTDKASSYDKSTITLNREVSNTIGDFTYSVKPIDLGSYKKEIPYSANSDSYYQIFKKHAQNFEIKNNVGILNGPVNYKETSAINILPYGIMMSKRNFVEDGTYKINVPDTEKSRIYTFLMVK